MERALRWLTALRLTLAWKVLPLTYMVVPMEYIEESNRIEARLNEAKLFASRAGGIGPHARKRLARI